MYTGCSKKLHTDSKQERSVYCAVNGISLLEALVVGYLEKMAMYTGGCIDM